MKKFISFFYDIRQDEWKRVFLMFGLHFLFMVILYLLKPARDSLFLTENGPDALPSVYILLALISLPVTYFLTLAMRRYQLRTVLMWTTGILATNLVLFRWLFEFGIHGIFMAFYIWVGLFGILVISLYWLLANAVFQPAQAKRVFPFLTLGAILGAITGSETSSLIVSVAEFSTLDLLIIGMFLLFLTIAILYFISTPASQNRTPSLSTQNKESYSIGKVARSVLRSQYQMNVAIIIGLTMMVTTFTDYQFKTLSFQAYPETSGLTAFLGLFYGGISLASLIIQVLLSKSIIKKLGLSGSILTRPVGMLIAAVLMAIEPVLASIILLNGFDSSTRYSIDKTGRELLFLPLSQQTKEKTKIFIDVFVDRFSRGLAGILLLVFIFLFNWSVYMITYIVLGLLSVWIYLGIKAKNGYINKFRNSLQKQLLGTDSIALNLNEPSIFRLIKESLHSENDVQVLHTLFLLRQGDTEMVKDELEKLLEHPNREIRLRSLKLLQKIKGVDYSAHIQTMLKDPDPEIRLESIYYVCQHSNGDPNQIMQSYLDATDDNLKSAALGCACRHTNDTKLVKPEYFNHLMKKEGPNAIVVRGQVADALGHFSDRELAAHYLDQLLDDQHPSVVKRAIESTGRQQLDRLIPKLIRKFQEEKYTLPIRKALAAYGSDHLALYKDKFRDQQLDFRIRKRIPGIFSLIPEQSSVNHLLTMLHIEDTELRYHVIKSLNKIYRDNPSLAINSKPVRSTLRNEIQSYYEMLSVKLLQPASLPNDLLLKALTEKMELTLERIFRLSGLIYNPKDMYGTYLGLQSLSAEKRSTAIEFLDNVLSETDKPYIIPLVDERNESKKMETALDLFDIAELRYDEGLLRLIDGEDRWLRVCALYSVTPQCPNILQDRVKEAAFSSDSLVRETAELVINRNAA